MKNIINILYLVLLFAITAACSDKDENNAPQTNVIGRWAWVETRCYCLFCRCLGTDPKTTGHMHYLDFDKDTITYFSQDTTIFKCSYSQAPNNVLDIKFEDVADTTLKKKYGYLLYEGKFSVSNDSLIIKRYMNQNDYLFLHLKRSVKLKS